MYAFDGFIRPCSTCLAQFYQIEFNDQNICLTFLKNPLILFMIQPYESQTLQQITISLRQKFLVS